MIKKLFFSILLTTSIAYFLSAQNYDKGSHNISGGISIFSSLYSIRSTFYSILGYYTIGSPVLIYEYGISDRFSLGWMGTYMFATLNTPKNMHFGQNKVSASLKYGNFLSGLRVSYQIYKGNQLQLYAGGTLGLAYIKLGAKGSLTNKGNTLANPSIFGSAMGVFNDIYGGARVFFSANFAMYLEINIIKAPINFGASFSF